MVLIAVAGSARRALPARSGAPVRHAATSAGSPAVPGIDLLPGGFGIETSMSADVVAS